MTNFIVGSRKRYNEVERSPGWFNNSNGIKVQRTLLDIVGGTKTGKNWGENRQTAKSLLAAIRTGRGSQENTRLQSQRPGYEAWALWFIDGLILDKSLNSFFFLLTCYYTTLQRLIQWIPMYLPITWLQQLSTQSNLVHLSQSPFLDYSCINDLLSCNKLPPNLVG